MGKVEGYGENWHGHVTAISVGPEYRRLGLAAKMMEWLEDVSSDMYGVCLNLLHSSFINSNFDQPQWIFRRFICKSHK